MRKSKPNLPLLFLAGALMIAASAPVAMRVEVEPQRADDEGTLVVVVIQVSPEDRSRIGDNAMVRIEIDGAAPPGQSPLWAISLENDGSAEIETTWPPGEHDLRVEIASPSGKDTGLWVGKVRIPELGGPKDVSTTPVRPTPVPTPVPEPDTPAVPAVAGAAVGTASVAEAEAAVSSPPEETAPLPVVAAEEVAEAGEILAEPEREGTESAPMDENQEPSETDLRMAADARTAEETEIESVVAGAVAERDEPAPPDPEEPVSEEIEAAAAAATAGAATTVSTSPPEVNEPSTPREATTPPEKQPVVEPVRSEASAPAAEPLRGDPATPAPVVPEKQPTGPSTEVLAAYQEWRQANLDATSLTVVVMRSRQPVPDLDADDLELRVGGSRVAVTGIGDASRAPLSLGVAVDLSAENVGRWGQVTRDLAPLVQRTGNGLGDLFVATTGSESDWGVDPGRMDEALVTPAGGDLAALIRNSLSRFEDRPGRTFLLVLTDGRIEPSKEAWRETTAALESAGVPVLVVALWDDGFKRKMRKNLQQVSSISGGRLFMLQSFDQMDGAVERYGAVLDAGVALRFESPEAGEGSSQVAVTSPDRTLDITAPKAIR